MRCDSINVGSIESSLAIAATYSIYYFYIFVTAITTGGAYSACASSDNVALNRLIYAIGGISKQSHRFRAYRLGKRWSSIDFIAGSFIP